MRPITKRFPNQNRIIVGAEGDNFWKGVFVGAGGLLAFGAAITLIGQSIQNENDRQIKEDKIAGKIIRDRAMNRDRLIGGHERY